VDHDRRAVLEIAIDAGANGVARRRAQCGQEEDEGVDDRWNRAVERRPSRGAR
jgi:hypothetical protein